ncbi:MAG: BNR repeat-containing protein [Sedimentisphaerales bacterium]|nr:BNR repeat-containing protein [Sedimentisphaerales bacterium]
MKRALYLIIICVFIINAQAVFAFPDVTKISDSVVATDSLTFSGGTYGDCINGLPFQQEGVISHNGYQYVTYWNDDGHVCVARRELPSGSWEIIEFTDYSIPSDENAHRAISIGICPNDGTIHLAFAHHSSTLNYRVSATGVASYPGSYTWSTSLFNSIRSYLKSGQTLYTTTYVGFFQTPDGDLQCDYRYGSSGNGDQRLVDYDGSSHTWGNYREFISRDGTYTDTASSTSRCPYLNLIGYDLNGRLHSTWVWRESAGGANHDLMYAYSDDGGYTWYNDKDSLFKIMLSGENPQTILSLKSDVSDANVVSDTSSQYIRFDSPGVTQAIIRRAYGLMNQHGQATDSQGRVHTVLWHCTSTASSTWGNATDRRYHHYWRAEDGTWRCNKLDWISGNRARLVIDDNDNAFLIYGAPANPSGLGTGIYFTDGTLTIAAATAATGWSDWQIIHTESGYFMNEMLIDPVRFANDQIISVFAQEEYSWPGQATDLRILEFEID